MTPFPLVTVAQLVVVAHRRALISGDRTLPLDDRWPRPIRDGVRNAVVVFEEVPADDPDEPPTLSPLSLHADQAAADAWIDAYTDRPAPEPTRRPTPSRRGAVRTLSA